MGAELIPTLMFYVFSAMVVLSAIRVISSKNPVHSVLFLILAFFNAAGLFVLLGAEFIAMTLVIVYVGAVAVLFLFVVMMLNINFEELREGFMSYLPLGGTVAGIVFVELVAVLYWSLHGAYPTMAPGVPTPSAAHITNTRAIGDVLYTTYIYPFEMAGIVLLIAMIGAIVLTHRTRPGVHKQVISSQMSRRRADSMEIVKVKSGEGIS